MEDQYTNNDPIILKLIIRDLMINLESDKRVSLKPWIRGLFEDPLVMFNEAYGRFTGGLGVNADAMDQWVTLQISVLSDLGEGRKVILQRFIELFNDTLISLPGGEGFIQQDRETLKVAPFQHASYLVALIIRVYGSMIDVVSIQQVEPA